MEKVNEQLQWLQELTGGESIRAIAKAICVPQRTLHTHANTGALTPEEIILISRRYGRNPIDSLAQLGFLTWDEVADSGRQSAADELPIKQLIDIALKRLDEMAYNIAYDLFRRPDRINTVTDARIFLSSIYKDYVGVEPVHPFTYPVDESGEIIESKCVPQPRVAHSSRRFTTVPHPDIIPSVDIAAQRPDRGGHSLEDEIEQTYND